MTTTATKPIARSAIRERPMLFSGPMVRAILDGRKTQTRRVAKVNEELADSMERNGIIDSFVEAALKMSPFQVGQRLWVRETWGTVPLRRIGDPPQRTDEIIYKADDDLLPDDERYIGRWRPSIHMPRWASRITLEIVSRRVERVQDISEGDALSEGFDKHTVDQLLKPVASKVKTEYMRWLHNDDTGDEADGDYCEDCADKRAQKLGEPWFVDGWDDFYESDSPRWCDDCKVLLNTSLTRYGIDSELMVGESTVAPATGDSAEIVYQIASGMGDYREELHAGRLAQTGFATLWDSINGKRPGCSWNDNPWLWAITFNHITQHERRRG